MARDRREEAKRLLADDIDPSTRKRELKRAMQYCGGVFRYAIATGRAEHDLTADLRGALPVHRVKHLASITDPRQVGQLLRALDGYTGDYSVACALRMAPLVFVRPGELRFAEWTEFDFDAAEWRIPAKRMKMREQHIVLLARQTLAILEDLKMVTGCGRFLFPSVRTPTRPMSGLLEKIGPTTARFPPKMLLFTDQRVDFSSGRVIAPTRQ
jgi:integrase